MVYTHRGIALERNEILTHATTRTNLEDAVLSLKRQRQRDKRCMTLPVNDSPCKRCLEYTSSFKAGRLERRSPETGDGDFGVYWGLAAWFAGSPFPSRGTKIPVPPAVGV